MAPWLFLHFLLIAAPELLQNKKNRGSSLCRPQRLALNVILFIFPCRAVPTLWGPTHAKVLCFMMNRFLNLSNLLVSQSPAERYEICRAPSQCIRCYYRSWSKKKTLLSHPFKCLTASAFLLPPHQ